MTREEWLDRRKTGLGATDDAAILGLNNYRTRYDVWLDKMGQAPPLEDNKFMLAGRILEPAIVEFFKHNHPDCKIIDLEDNYIINHPEHDFIFGSPDRMFIDELGRKQVLECKSSSKKLDLDMPPEAYFVQLTIYMGLTGCEFGTMAVLEKGVDYQDKVYEFVPEFYEYIIAECVAFWNDHVLTGIPPELTTSDDVLKKFPQDAGTILEADEDMLKIHEELSKLVVSKNQCDTAMEALKTEVKLRMVDNSGVSYLGEKLFTWKTSKNGTSFDAKAFEKENPELHESFLRFKQGSRTFLIK